MAVDQWGTEEYPHGTVPTTEWLSTYGAQCAHEVPSGT